jgi:hypothetical protein
MLIEITKEQLNDLNMLFVLCGYYLENIGVDNDCYESDKEMVEDGQAVLTYLYKQFKGV